MKNQQVTSIKTCKVIDEHYIVIKIIIYYLPVLETNLPIENGLKIKKKTVRNNIFLH
jgi:hypothetical protein